MTDKQPYNDPFYFALPRGVPMSALSEAEKHIRKTFGITGRPEVLRHELAFTLCRLTDVAKAGA